ncbi:MAG: hypothetical protein ACE5HB_07635 [Terriglobia bacterium]
MKRFLALFALLLFSAFISAGDVLLTTPVPQPSVLGGAGTISYDTLEILSFTVDPQAGSVNVGVQLTASADPNRPPLSGSYVITTSGGNPNARLTIPTIGFDQAASLSAPQVTAAQGDIANFVQRISTSMTGFGLVEGTVQ